MRHLATLPLLATVLVGGLLAPLGNAGAQEPGTPEPITQELGTQSLGGPTSGAGSTIAELRAEAVLAEATALFEDAPPVAARRAAPRPAREATLVLRDLRLAVPDLAADDRREAQGLLARPTDGDADPQRQGYSTPSTRRCGGPVCVHYVTRTPDRATGAWAKKTLKVMGKVWRKEVGALGYRRPVSDGGLPRRRNGGNGKFDVYLTDLGASSLYGYCAGDFVVRAEPRRAGGYCVLDNDFASSQYGRPPSETLAVTAAHEFFHAIQFGYDFYEDRWFMESTATWMEERYADAVDDNRQFLPYGQVRVPETSLDLFDRSGFTHYGNWPFWEYLSEREGNRVVRSAWNRARGKTYSLEALERVLARSGGLTARYADFAAANLTPRERYPEGQHWPSSTPQATWHLAADGAHREDEVKIDHLASASYVAVPDVALMGSGWEVTFTIDGPSRGSSPAAWVVVRTAEGDWTSRQVPLDRRGRGSVTAPFSRGLVNAVSLTLVNASTRYRCDQGVESWSCGGSPRDEGKRFSVAVDLARQAESVF